ncbi:MAG: DUF2523 domain-containing protein [Xanthomonadales bacterium]|nr:DUF2523 domain-containing protein [Xanthomonadales bacterium]
MPVLGEIIAASILGTVVKAAAKLLLAFGLVVVVSQYAIGPMFDHALSLLPSSAGEWIDLSGVPEAVSVVASAYAVRVAKRVFFGSAQAAS